MAAQANHATEQGSPAPFDRIGIGIKVVSYLILIGGSLVRMLLVIWMAATACKPNAQLAISPIRFFPQTPS